MPALAITGCSRRAALQSLLVGGLVVSAARGQVSAAPAVAFNTTFRSTYYEQKRTLYEVLPNTRREIIFLGNSITDTAELTELLQNRRVKNWGISGDTSFGVLARLDEVTSAQPAKIFLMIGSNDLARDIPDSLIVRNYWRIMQRIRHTSPRTAVYLQSILPTNGDFPQFKRHQQKEAHIRVLNQALRALAAETGQHYVDLHPYLADEQGRLAARYTNDGLHINGAGYVRWVRALDENHYL